MLQVGKGDSIRFRHNRWICNLPLKTEFSRIFALSVNKDGVITDFGCISNGEWGEDWYAWKGNGDGVFSVYSCIRLISSLSESDASWSELVWRGLVPSKVEVFLWQIIHQKLPVKTVLLSRGVKGIENSKCTICGLEPESVNHLFFSCKQVWEIWVKFLQLRNVFSVLPNNPKGFLLSWLELRPNSILEIFAGCRIVVNSLVGDLTLADVHRSPSKIDISNSGIGGVLRDVDNKRIIPFGEPPSPRAAHVATAVVTMIVIQGGIGPTSMSGEDLHVLDLTQKRSRCHRVVVQGPGPGPRYGHVMALLGQRYLMAIGGNDDVWALDTAAKPYEWRKLEPEGEGPPPCMYATASARSDGILLLCGGRDANSVPLASAYGLAKHRDGRSEWAIAPGVSPSPRYQYAAVFVNVRLHVSGGALGGGRMVEDSSSVAVLDTAAGVWCDTKSVVTSPRTSRYIADAAGVLLDDLLVAEDLAAAETTTAASHAAAAANAASHARLPGRYVSIDGRARQTMTEAVPDGAVVLGTPVAPPENAMLQVSRKMGKGVDYLVEASAAEAEVISATLAAAKARQMPDSAGSNNVAPAGVRLHHRAVVIAAETGGALGGMVRQLSIDQLENEGRRVSYGTPENASAARKLLDRQMSINIVPEKVLVPSSFLLHAGPVCFWGNY
ncbi:Serine/threonine-protein phosphatase BSL2-like protein [Hibiscus syriacus]|uniref:Serine/threonine-protein phosphatase BSL2-like protein n=1 Tax=Hibiscus syriacus TaxID=106335 RepID=A0A6A3CQ10_HIBSY|nr:Serine/threonine-protein phosphatase BSL2-like protein [Hibiscus syriacus]